MKEGEKWFLFMGHASHTKLTLLIFRTTQNVLVGNVIQMRVFALTHDTFFFFFQMTGGNAP
jgi:hypothetical protein